MFLNLSNFLLVAVLCLRPLYPLLLEHLLVPLNFLSTIVVVLKLKNASLLRLKLSGLLHIVLNTLLKFVDMFTKLLFITISKKVS